MWQNTRILHIASSSLLILKSHKSKFILAFKSRLQFGRNRQKYTFAPPESVSSLLETSVQLQLKCTDEARPMSEKKAQQAENSSMRVDCGICTIADNSLLAGIYL